MVVEAEAQAWRPTLRDERILKLFDEASRLPHLLQSSGTDPGFNG